MNIGEKLLTQWRRCGEMGMERKDYWWYGRGRHRDCCQGMTSWFCG